MGHRLFIVASGLSLLIGCTLCSVGLRSWFVADGVEYGWRTARQDIVLGGIGEDLRCLKLESSRGQLHIDFNIRPLSNLDDLDFLGRRWSVEPTVITSRQAGPFGFRYSRSSDRTHGIDHQRWWRIECPHWAAAAPAAVLPLMSIAGAIARYRRRRPAAGGRCASCGYDLRATPERCPECGALPAAAR